MTLFTAAQLPSGLRACSTVEMLLLWCAYILRKFTVKETFQRAAGFPEESICAITRFTDSSGINRVQIFVVLPESESSEQLLADWTTVNPIATTAIPPAYSN
jgi:hypothetical protein